MKVTRTYISGIAIPFTKYFAASQTLTVKDHLLQLHRSDSGKWQVKIAAPAVSSDQSFYYIWISRVADIRILWLNAANDAR